ncbi:hypothetical protein BDQ17DRAFT_1430147 [Cyathus striatus]|nr:hypothetical protein BDQ17DRAFT_1430147 [Cyathus striatus]
MKCGVLLKRLHQERSKASGSGKIDETPISRTSIPPASLGDHPDYQVINFWYYEIQYETEVIYHLFTKFDYPDNALIVTRIPNTSTEPSTELVVCAKVKHKILNTPGFPSPLPLQCEPPTYEIKHTGTDMGLRMLTTRNLEVGDLILIE